MLAKIGEPFSSDDYLFEIKWDGTRAIALIEDDDYRLINRNRRPLKDRYPELGSLADLPPGTVLDGEIVVLVDGKPDFNGMLRREQAHNPHRIRTLAATLPATYVVFDLLYRDGDPITERPLVERRQALQELLGDRTESRLVFSDGIVGDGLAFYEEACRRELEGVVAKRLQSRYLPGRRSDSWLKIKRSQKVYCAIIGFMPDGDDSIRSLVVALEEEGALTYAGRVGSGLDTAKRAQLSALLRARLRPDPLIPCPVKDALFVEPGLYCAVSFLERTPAGELRAPVFVEMISG
jgi:DNA ligase D-like protein (predicted ligase)